ncbi:hypothetical protein KGF54_005415 [Candida jiufengensis]|uniref:uncharacterized protein n=1 Tax=Candida jiufengensis TaxID=497108 RepID=UPI0022244280|nr:uncharacterized protein KGF54_005415 [Candida jiufengensis]KAI5949538.1 hypothetical protein KGF54_005415 [Candida jiufengensis]
MVHEIYSFTLNQLDDLERNLLFDSFNSKIAWKFGEFARSKCIEKYENKSIVIDITLTGGHTLFHTVIGESTNIDNDNWIKRKSNTVFRFGKSSFYIGQKLRIKEKSIEEAMFVSSNEFASHGGSIPIKIKNFTGVIGTFTISGLAQEQDHLLAIEITEGFINKFQI